MQPPDSPSDISGTLPVTVVVAVKNEAVNIGRCLAALKRAARVLVIDSASQDDTARLAAEFGAEVVQFVYPGGYPKKRQWALDHLPIGTDWILLIDADEVVPDALWKEIERAVASPDYDGYLIRKGFHFLGRRFRFGGFSHQAVCLVRKGRARFEELIDDSADALDMEVHERMIVRGSVGTLSTPLIHEDFKGLQAYLARHNSYSTWEARLRWQYHCTDRYGRAAVTPKLTGNAQERHRWLKLLILRLPFEPWIWFAYHFFVRLGFLEGRRGMIACQIRADYIRQVRAKLFELEQKSQG